MPVNVAASIVLYRNNEAILLKAIQSFLSSPVPVKLYLIDNSPTDQLKRCAADARIEYIFNGKNLGFGKAHNIALKKSVLDSPYHVVLNPDVYFGPEVIPALVAYMDEHPDVGQISPLILYPDGRIQYSGKLLPTPLDLIARRIFSGFHYFRKRNDVYELSSTGYDRTLNVPNHLGCFMFMRTKTAMLAGLFDERIFMYLEDIDMTRRIHRYSRTLFYPAVRIYHHYEKGSQRKFRLLLYHIHGAIIYFTKWGWFHDPERVRFNAQAQRESREPTKGSI